MPKLALLFPGQGSQYPGMGKLISEKYPIAAETFDQANAALEFDFKKLCFEGSSEELSWTENSQPAILAASVALFRVYMQEVGIEPEFMAGHSLGEYSALVCAGSLEFAEALRITRLRGKFMQEAVPAGQGLMTAIKNSDQKTIEKICRAVSSKKSSAWVSTVNSPKQIAISGHKEAVEAAKKKLAETGAACVDLKVSAPFHCPLMAGVGPKLRKEFGIKFKKPKYRIVANVTGTPYAGAGDIEGKLIRQISEPVQWLRSMKYLDGRGIDTAIEIGPRQVLANLLGDISDKIKAFSFEKPEDLDGLRFLSLEREGGISLMAKCLTAAVGAPNLNWNEREYKKGCEVPIKKLGQILDELEAGKISISVGAFRQAMELLERVLVAKKVPASERKEIQMELVGLARNLKL